MTYVPRFHVTESPIVLYLEFNIDIKKFFLYSVGMYPLWCTFLSLCVSIYISVFLSFCLSLSLCMYYFYLVGWVSSMSLLPHLHIPCIKLYNKLFKSFNVFLYLLNLSLGP